MTIILRYVLPSLVALLFGIYGISWIKTTLFQASQYQVLQDEKASLVQNLVDEKRSAEDREKRLEADRIELQEHHIKFERDAIQTELRLRKALDGNEKNKAWHDGNIPDDIRRLRDERRTTSKLDSQHGSSESTN